MPRRTYAVTVETTAEHIDGVGEVFTAHVVKGAPKRWHGMSVTNRDTFRSFAYVDLCNLIQRRYPKVRFKFYHRRA